MTFLEIISLEDSKTDSIYLYREGMFMKAYERSAFFAHTLIHEFKLSKTVPKWLNGYVYEWVQEGLIRCRMTL